jgi:integrase
LVRALSDATRHHITITNAGREQPPPRAPGRKVAVPSENAIAPMLEALRGDSFYVPVLLTLTTAIRRGELLGLAWRHVDLEAATVKIERALDQTSAGVSFKRPKTESGERTISLPAAAVAALRKHWLARAELGFALGVGRPSGDDLLFGRIDVSPRARTRSRWLGSGP